MSQPAFHGDPRIQWLGRTYEGDSTSGLRAVDHWRGRTVDLENFIPFFLFTGCKISMRREGMFSSLETRYPDAQDGLSKDDPSLIATTWDMPEGGFVELDLMDHPAIRAWQEMLLGPTGEPDEIYQTIQTQWREVIDGDRKFSTWIHWTGLTTAAKAITALMMRGVRSQRRSTFTLRRTSMVPGSYTGTFASENVDRQFTLAQMTSIEGLPATLVVNVPSTGVWIKNAPGFTQNAQGQWTIVNTWVHGESASSILFPAAA